MSNNPYISVIVPIYNAEKYINQCLDSILCQSYSNFEVLLIDDCSSDSSLEICKLYLAKDKRIKLFRQQLNGGESKTRNRGLKEAIGRYIVFIDADDVVLSDYIQNFFYVDNIPKGTLVHAPHLISRNNVLYNNTETQFYNIEDLFNNNINKYDYLFAGPAWSKLLDGEIIRENKLIFKEDIKMNVDHTFHLEYLLFVNSYVNVGKKTLVYFDRPNSLSKKVFPYEDYERRLFYMLPLTMKVIERFKIEDKMLIMSLYSTPVHAIVAAFYSLYLKGQKKSLKDRVVLLNKMIRNEYYIILDNYWKPTQFHNKILFIALKSRNPYLINFLLKIIVAIKNIIAFL